MKRLPVRGLPKEGLSVLEQQANESLTDEAPAHGAKSNRRIVGLELLLRFGQDVKPEGGVALEGRREILKGFVVLAVFESRFAHLKVFVRDDGFAHSVGKHLPGGQTHLEATLQVALGQHGWVETGQVAQGIHERGVDLVGGLNALLAAGEDGLLARLREEEPPVDRPRIGKCPKARETLASLDDVAVLDL